MITRISTNWVLTDESPSDKPVEIVLMNLKTNEKYSPFDSFFFEDKKGERTLTLASHFVHMKIKDKTFNDAEKEFISRFLDGSCIQRNNID